MEPTVLMVILTVVALLGMVMPNLNLPNIGALLGRLGGKAAAPAGGFKETVVSYDGDDFTVSVVATTGVPYEHPVVAVISTAFTEIWSHTVKAQQMKHLGFGSAQEPYNQGYLHFEPKSDHATAPVAVEGMVRIWVNNARRTKPQLVYQGRSEPLHPATESKETMIAFPEQLQTPWVAEDSIITIELKADVGQNIGWGAEITDGGGDCTKLRIPVTVRE